MSQCEMARVAKHISTSIVVLQNFENVLYADTEECKFMGNKNRKWARILQTNRSASITPRRPTWGSFLLSLLSTFPGF